MAKKEGYCSECGSLLNFDDSKDKILCIFCGEEVDTKKALDLNEDNESRINIQKVAEEKAKIEAAKRKERQKNAKPTPKDIIKDKQNSPKEEIVLKPLPKKMKIALIAVPLSLVVVLFAIFVPLLTSRNAKRITMHESMEKEFKISIDSYSYNYNNNRELVISTDNKITEADALTIYNSYMQIYAKTYDITTEKANEKLTVIIYFHGGDNEDESGRYIIKYVDENLKIKFETGIAAPTLEETIE